MTGEDRTGQDAVYPTHVGMSRSFIRIEMVSHCLSHESGNESIIDGRMYDTDTFIPRRWE